METLHEVISFTPSGNVFTFRDLHHAKVTLLKEFHHTIVSDAMALAQRHTSEELSRIYRKFTTNPQHEAELFKARTHEAKALMLWPILVTAGRTNIELAKMKGKAKHREPVVYCIYVPEVDPITDETYRRLPRQARVIVDIAREHVPEQGVPESTFYKLVHEHAERLKTKQDPWRVYKYYEHKLFSRRLLKIEE